MSDSSLIGEDSRSPSHSVTAAPRDTKRKQSGFRLDNLPISIRLIAAMILPVLAVLWMSGNAIYTARTAETEQNRLNELTHLAQKISATVHELQKERGMSAGFINSKGKLFATELPNQRKLTDGTLKTTSAAFDLLDTAKYGEQIANLITGATTALNGLKAMRERVSGAKATVPQMAGYYTPTIAKLLKIIEFMTRISQEATVNNSISAYTAFLQAKERAGIERAMGAAGFGAGKFAPAIHQKFIGLIAAQESFLAVFRNFATTDQVAFFGKTMVGPIIDTVEQMRKIAKANPATGATEGITGKQWFGAITQKINLMKTVEDRIAQDLVGLTETNAAAAAKTFWTSIASIAGTLVVTLLLTFYIVTGITRPMTQLAHATSRLADGDTASEIDLYESGDEVGTLVKATKVFRENLIETTRLQVEQKNAEEKAQADAQRRIAEERDAAAKEAADQERAAQDAAARAEKMEQIIASFDRDVSTVLETVSSAATEMRGSAEALTQTADHTSQQSSAVAAASEEAATNMQTVASAAEELSASVGEISRQVAESSKIAETAVAESGSTNAKIQGLAEAAQKIGDVVNLINDIASQTNSLALNATIEAARAGDAGKGFAVVASEVKSLATQTAKATEEIGGQIAGIQEATGEAVTAIEGITSVISQINEISTAIATAVEQQGSATREIAGNVQQAAAGTQEVNGNIVEVSQAASETGQSAGQVLSAADELSKQGEVMRSRVDRFLEEIRAA